MLVFPEMLMGAAEQAGMKTPSDSDNFNPKKFPHFQVFCKAQLGRPMNPEDHWENAKVIAKIPDSQIMKIDVQGLLNLGFITKD
ncbi:hypothetical protein LCGC14_0729620 [marine sediment metagenome]|uniref:Uncharacterized protein n=1 Tax=marine sediment metagenome TaxID=412755 RepID=A0A0F9QA52_9ZZZZ